MPDPEIRKTPPLQIKDLKSMFKAVPGFAVEMIDENQDLLNTPELIVPSCPDSTILEKALLFFEPPSRLSTFRESFEQAEIAYMVRLTKKIRSFGNVILATKDIDDEQALHIAELRQRMGMNFLSGIQALLEGYQGEKRWTGEGKWVHSTRVFLRLASNILPKDAKTLRIAYISYLGALLHDAREDFEGFEITSVDENYAVLKFNKKGDNHEFNLFLNQEEVELLNLQLDAVSTPDEPNGNGETPQEKAQRQFDHLHTVTEVIRQKYGPLNAFYTLRMKVEDRLDNLCTYWKKNILEQMSPPDREKLIRKLAETMSYFKAIEPLAAQYYAQSDAVTKPYAAEMLSSAKELCYFFWIGGTVDEAFFHSLGGFASQYPEYFHSQDPESIYNDPNLIIPVLAPINQYHPVILENVD